MTEYRRADASDYDAIIDFSNKVFTRKVGKNHEVVYDRTYFQTILPKLYRNPSTAPYHLLALEDGEIAACVATFPLPFRVMGTALRCGGIGTVGVRAESRGRGHMIRLMQDSIEAGQRDGYDFMLLSGQRQRYEHFGFAQAGLDPAFALTATNVRHAFGRRASFGYTFRPLAPEDRDLLMKIDALYRQSPSHLDRDASLTYDSMLAFYAEPYAVFAPDGSFFGSLLLRRCWHDLCDLRLCDGAKAAMVLNDFLHFTHLRALTLRQVPLFDTALCASLASVCEDTAAQHSQMIRVFRYEPLLRAYFALQAQTRPLPDGTLCLGFASGEVLRMAVTGGVPTVAADAGEPDMRLSDREAVQLLFGHFSAVCGSPLPLPAAPRAWFPLPFHLDAADAV